MDGLGSILLGAAEDVALGASVVAELVNLSHGTVGDETDESVGREQAQANNERLTQGLKIVIIHAGVDDVEKDGRDLSRTAEGILDGGVLGKKLGGKVGAADVFVVGWESIARKTEGQIQSLPRTSIWLRVFQESKSMVAKGKTHIDHQVRGLLCTLYRVGRHWDNLPVGVENSSARRLASNGLVKNGRKDPHAP